MIKPDSSDFRPDINGLRAVAVLSVVLFHFDIAGFSGGFVGVDVFFVISGYLMTRIILTPLAEDCFSVWRFYLARARRIFPALAMLCALMLAYGWFQLSPMDYKALIKHIGASLLFISNQTYWKESGYFDVDSHEKWLLHTWSLSVEWQFYLIYPLLIVAMHRLFRRPEVIAAFLWAIFLSSFAWSIWLAHSDPSKAFYLLPTRTWEMLAGGLINLHQNSLNRWSEKRRWFEIMGILAIIGASMGFSRGSTWPGINALLPVAGAAMVIANNSGKTRLLGHLFIQSIGRWSYSIYLWHWPIAVWLYQDPAYQNAAWIATGMVASVAIGWLSFSLVEIPARDYISRFRLLPALTVSAAMVMTPFAVAYAFRHQYESLTNVRFKDHSRLADVRALEEFQAHMLNVLYKPLYREGSCFLTPEKSHVLFAPECAGRPGGILLWGDSHAAHLWPGLKSKVPEGMATQWTASGCPPLLDEEFTDRKHCRAINDWVLSQVLETRPQLILLAGAWVKYDETTIRRGLEKTLLRLNADPSWHPRIVLIGSVPIWRNRLPRLLASDFLNGDERERSNKALDSDMYRRDELLRKIVGTRVQFFSPVSVACSEEGCLRYFIRDGSLIPFAFDYGHLVEESSLLVMASLFHQLRENHVWP